MVCPIACLHSLINAHNDQQKPNVRRRSRIIILSRIVQIYNFTLTLGGASAVPSSSRVILYSDDVTWTVYINKTCSDNFYHWTSEKELTNCVTYVWRALQPVSVVF